MAAAVEEATFLADLRDTEIETHKATKLPELKTLALMRGLKFKSNIRKDRLIEMIVVERCKEDLKSDIERHQEVTGLDTGKAEKVKSQDNEKGKEKKSQHEKKEDKEKGQKSGEEEGQGKKKEKKEKKEKKDDKEKEHKEKKENKYKEQKENQKDKFKKKETGIEKEKDQSEETATVKMEIEVKVKKEKQSPKPPQKGSSSLQKQIPPPEGALPPMPPPNEPPPKDATTPKAAAGGQTAAMVMAPGGSHVEASSSSGCQDKETKGDEQHDITNQIFPIDDAEEQDKEVSNKEKFLRADLLVPGISLKKFKLALDEEDAVPPNMLSLLCVGEICRYKVKKPMLQRMVIGDPSRISSFWEQAARHLDNNPLAAIFLTSDTQLSISEAWGRENTYF